MSYKPHYSRFLGALGTRLHFCAHSHHPWPDVTRDAQIAAWDDAAAAVGDGKWAGIVARLLPEARRGVAEAIEWPDPDDIAIAPNTHEFILRLLSCLPPDRAPRLLTTDSEFHSFARQAARLEEAGAQVERVPVEPIATFTARMRGAIASWPPDLVFVSHVFFNSGLRLQVAELEAIAEAAPRDALVVIDGYHAFMAVPMDLARLYGRAFYLGGGYKYAQAGEGICFLAVPRGCALRPSDTGWFADFSALDGDIRAPVTYDPGGRRFQGSTFDPTGVYRWNAVTAWRAALGLDIATSDAHVRALQRAFLARLASAPRGPLGSGALVSTDLERTGHFLTFRLADARAWALRLADLGVLVDARGDRLRFGFGLYHDEADLGALFERLAALS